ncbi:MAG: hypothetical protein HY904_02880 [Deltaproteobacteria bacterium]|nr:hypothetical protein [Deltaproteobacteria bacterium]
MARNDEDDVQDDPQESGGVADALRRLLISGVGTFLTTEEGVRTLLKEIKLPKEVATYLLHQAENTKEEVVSVLGREMRAFLETLDTQRLFERAIQHLVLDVHAEIRFKLDSRGKIQPVVRNLSPQARRRPRPRRAKG